MSRATAIMRLHGLCGTLKAIDLVNYLQERGLISDNVIEPGDTATCDLISACHTLSQSPLQTNQTGSGGAERGRN